jgi:hypothetical protein
MDQVAQEDRLGQLPLVSVFAAPQHEGSLACSDQKRQGTFTWFVIGGHGGRFVR